LKELQLIHLLRNREERGRLTGYIVTNNIVLFVSVALVSTCVYLFSGGYNFGAEVYSIKSNVNLDDALYLAYRLPFREFSVYIYVIFYYLILSQYLIKNHKHIVYFFHIFEKVFYVAVVIGVVGLFFSLFDVQLLSRQFNYGEGIYIGVRFHGVFGEPRDASVALIFSLAIFNLKNIYFGKNNNHYKYLWIVLFLLITTVSGSLSIAFLIFIPMYVLFYGNKLKLFNMRNLLLFVIFISIFYLYVISNSRLWLYFEQALMIPGMIENEIKLPYHIKNQIVNIYPFWLTYLKIINFDLFSLLFGSGLGVTAIEVYPNGPYEFGTAHSQLPRLIFETGVVGFLAWSFMLFFYMKYFRFILTHAQWRTLFFYFVLVCSAALAHRSHLIYIYVSIAFSVYNLIAKVAVKNA